MEVTAECTSPHLLAGSAANLILNVEKIFYQSTF